jgi:predicted TIM-barrel fold metal-dependent hydrolase
MIEIVDSQIHPYAARPADPVSAAAQRPPRMLEAHEIVSEMDRAGVARAVLVPPRTDITPNEYAISAAVRWPGRFAVMAKLLIDSPKSATLVAQWTQSSVLGFRVSFPMSGPDPTEAEWLWRAAEERGFPVMVWAPGRLRSLSNVASMHPNARIIVDHLGLGPADRGATVGDALRELMPLASLPNVGVKASALPSHSTEHYPFADLHDHVREVVRRFGAFRVFWGSDLTTQTCAYEEAVRMFTEALGFEGDELQLVMGAAIRNWLNWGGAK